MPPAIKVTKEAIMAAALRMVREKGIECLNARDLAKEIGCSVHPLFRAYESMDGLKAAVYKTAESLYNERMLSGSAHTGDAFLDMGLAYVYFAQEEKNLFRLLFMSDAFGNQSIGDIAGSTEGDDAILEMLCQRTKLSKKAAQELYTGIWLTTHGIAAMFATNSCRFNDEEIRRFLNNSFMGLLLKLKNEEAHQ